ncbi:bifunctional ornithine acetyltransferase/N-acetylglutamate synthase [PVC group bacterium (ex Bugula neritina AB1)]|nr:bifunctional ornithine acetyltransferase/N-acetylglutamate synthase [PVC group bacterium (ex Bugula neritina AB1)]
MLDFKGLTYPKGFRVATGFANIKTQGPDMLILLADEPVDTCAVFTTNRWKASSVLLAQDSLKKTNNRVQAILVNSGNANAATGKEGAEDTLELISHLAAQLKIDPSLVLMNSTGVIGQRLPIDNMKNEINAMVKHFSTNDTQSPQAILTTDLCTKAYSSSFMCDSSEKDPVKISAIAKGSGMIHPKMATMLSYITTDIFMDFDLLKKIFKECIDTSFHCISVDGDQSTNDSVILMSNPNTENSKILDISDKRASVFKENLANIMKTLAKDIVYDGEGATKFITVKVTGASNYTDAHNVAMTIAKSSLVKTAMFGSDPNWGRIIAAAGSTDVFFDPAKTSLYLQGELVLKNNQSIKNNPKLDKLMQEKNINILLDLGLETTSPCEAECWTCDLSYNYVKINAEYRT